MVKEWPVVPVAFVNDSLEDRQREIAEQGQRGLEDLVEYTLPRLRKFDDSSEDQELLEVDFRVRDMRNAEPCDALRKVPLKGLRLGYAWIGYEYLRVQGGQEVAERPIAVFADKIKSRLTGMATVVACITHI